MLDLTVGVVAATADWRGQTEAVRLFVSYH
jgi:hypothetical protein